MANITATEIKAILKKAGDRSGFAFDKNGPHFVNAERYSAMKAKFEDIMSIERNAARISERTRQAIDNYFRDIRSKYCL